MILWSALLNSRVGETTEARSERLSKADAGRREEARRDCQEAYSRDCTFQLGR